MNKSFYHTNYERQNEDYYSTDPLAIDYLLQHESFDNHIWECACGNGNLSERLKEHGYNVYSTDLINRGYGDGLVDFLKCGDNFKTLGWDCGFCGDIITNPPYKYATEFVLKALELSNRKVAMFLKIQFLESQKRYDRIFSKFPPKKVLPFVKRIDCWRNDDRSLKGSTVLYAWFVWDKEYNGKTVIEWINNE